MYVVTKTRSGLPVYRTKDWSPADHRLARAGKERWVIAFSLPLLVLELTPAILSNGSSGRACAADSQ
jgi:hypothetical protein